MPDTLPVIDHPKRNYILLIVGELLWFFALNLYLNFTALYIRNLGASPIEVGLYYTIFSVCALAAVLIGGPLTARIGEKAVFLLSWGIMVLSPIIFLLAPSWHWTLATAVVEGISMVASAPIGSYIGYLTGGKRSGLAYTTFAAIGAIGGILGPLLGGFLIIQTGYTSVFQLAALFYFISTLFIIPLSSVKRKEDATKPIWERGFFSNKVFFISTLLFGVVMGLYTVASFFLPLYLYDRFGLIENQIGLLNAIMNATILIASPLLGAAGDRWGYSGAITLSVLSYFAFFGMVLVAPSAFFLPLAYIVNGIGSRFSTLLMAIFPLYLKPNQLPNAFAVYSFSGRILTPVSPLLGGFGYAINPSLPLLAVTLTTPIPIVFIFLLYRAQKQEKKINTTK
ncbi:MAG: MFS transporter [Candidatus Thorarchaeota archaeon]